MAFSSTATRKSTVASTNISTTVEKDVEVTDLPTDSISSLSFSSQNDYMAVGSWDNTVRIYEVSANLQTVQRAMYTHKGPILSTCWSKDGTKVFSGGVDHVGLMFDAATGQTSQMAQHDEAIKVVKWIDAHGGILATGSWDKTIKYWDLRTPNPVSVVNLPERCYTFDAQFPLMVVGTAERHIEIFDLNRSPNQPFKVGKLFSYCVFLLLIAFWSILSPLRWQTRVVSCFNTSENRGFAVGSLEGRVAIQYLEGKNAGDNYSFRCHRREQQGLPNHPLVYAVNNISFHPTYGTFSTCGSDGTVHFWDRDNRLRLKSMTCSTAGGPISTSAFNRNGNILAYAASYDWSQGYSGVGPEHRNKLMLHLCKDEEVKERPKAAR